MADNNKLYEEFYIINSDILSGDDSCACAQAANPALNVEGFLSKIEGFKTRCKNLHWSAPKNNIHMRLDEFLAAMDDFEDKIAEGVMGIIGKFGPNSVNGENCEASNAIELMECVKGAVNEFYQSLPEDICWKGVSSECENFIQDVNKYTYLFKLCDVN